MAHARLYTHTPPIRTWCEHLLRDTPSPYSMYSYSVYICTDISRTVCVCVCCVYTTHKKPPHTTITVHYLPLPLIWSKYFLDIRFVHW